MFLFSERQQHPGDRSPGDDVAGYEKEKDKKVDDSRFKSLVQNEGWALEKAMSVTGIPDELKGRLEEEVGKRLN